MVQTEPREQREQCQACLSIAESRPRSIAINAIELALIAEMQPVLANFICKDTKNP